MKPRTEAQKLASRLNGARSKGPVTPEGKAKVSLNAVTHGLHAINPVLHAENPEEWKLFLNDHVQQWKPDSLPEWDLVVNDLAGTKWRLKRLLATEIALMDLESERVQDSILQACARPDADLLIAASWESLQGARNLALDRLHRQETRLRRIIEKAQSRLEAIAAARHEQQEQQQQNLQSDQQQPAEATAATPDSQTPPQPRRPVLVPRPGDIGGENKPEPAATAAPEASENRPAFGAIKHEKEAA